MTSASHQTDAETSSVYLHAALELRPRALNVDLKDDESPVEKKNTTGESKLLIQ